MVIIHFIIHFTDWDVHPNIPGVSRVPVGGALAESLRKKWIVLTYQQSTHTLWQTNIAIENGHRNSGFTH